MHEEHELTSGSNAVGPDLVVALRSSTAQLNRWRCVAGGQRACRETVWRGV